jgi:hypothetical protein
MQKYNAAREQVEMAIKLDPTESHYVEWLIKLMAKGRLLQNEKFLLRVRKALDAFNKLKEQPIFKESKDINSYTSAEALFECIQKYRQYTTVSTYQQKRELKSGARVVYRSPQVTWLAIETPEQATILSSGTSWCTLGKDHTMGYLQYGRLYTCYINQFPTLLTFIPNDGVTEPRYEFPEVGNPINDDLIADFDAPQKVACMENKRYLPMLIKLTQAEHLDWKFVGPADFQVAQ